jgi:hypothetical protein
MSPALQGPSAERCTGARFGGQCHGDLKPAVANGARQPELYNLATDVSESKIWPPPSR